MHLSSGVLFNDLDIWYEKYTKKESKKRLKALSTPVEGAKYCPNPRSQDTIFKAPTFQGDALQGGAFIEGIDRFLYSAAITRYLELHSYWENNPC